MSGEYSNLTRRGIEDEITQLQSEHDALRDVHEKLLRGVDKLVPEEFKRHSLGPLHSLQKFIIARDLELTKLQFNYEVLGALVQWESKGPKPI